MAVEGLHFIGVRWTLYNIFWILMRPNILFLGH